MTFEEFKQYFETFAKIDTPEKLAICEKQYRQHLLLKEDSNFFEPSDEPTGESPFIHNYTANLHSIFGFNRIKKDQILFLIQPSFEPEQLFTIEKFGDHYALTHTALEESYWSIYYQNNSISTTRTKVSTGIMEKVVGDKVFDLIEKSLIDARKPQSAFAVLDGILYKLSKMVNGKRKDVFKHSPDENSKTRRIIQLLEIIIELTVINPTIDSQNEIERLITLIQSE